MAHAFRFQHAPLFCSRLIRRLKNVTLSQNKTFSSAPENQIVAVHLDHRSLLHIAGKDSENFLQGLITNDIQQLSSGSHSLYAMFLNTKGRVMYDALFYKNAEKDGIFLECDKTVVESLEKHLKIYRLRKNVEIKHMPEVDVWAAFNPLLAKFDNSCISSKGDSVGKSVIPNDIVAIQPSEETSLDLEALTSCNVVLFRDPRLSLLGVRVFCSENENVASLLDLSLDNDISHYHLLRYKLGIAEGITDLPPGECFPLESNCDYLNGVSFHKGCYIGQELTARVHHTGVVRKRLMPILLESPLQSTNVSSLQVTDSAGKVVGKMRNVQGTSGIALLRISEALNSGSLHVDGVRAYTTIPSWWPCQNIKEAESKISF